jgi:HK97 family phage portal protein
MGVFSFLSNIKKQKESKEIAVNFFDEDKEDIYPPAPLTSSYISDKGLLNLYKNTPELYAIITYVAQVCSNVTIKHYKKLVNGTEKEVKNSEILALLKRPNEYKSSESFLIDLFSSFFVYGNVYLNFMRPIGFSFPSKIYILPSCDTFPIPVKSIDDKGTPYFDTDPRLNPVLHYNYFLSHSYKKIEKETMLHIKDCNISQEGSEYYLGFSRLRAAIKSSNTLMYLYDAINNTLENRGAMGIIKKNDKPNSVSRTLTSEDKRNIERKFTKNYGITGAKTPIAIVDADLSYMRIDVPISDFMPIELKADLVKTICRCIGNIPDSLFSSDSSSTYNNQIINERRMYTNCIMPIVELVYSELSNYFKLVEKGEIIKPYWGDVECLQEDNKLMAEVEKIRNENFKIAYDAGIISKEFWQESLNYPKYESAPTPDPSTAQRAGG